MRRMPHAKFALANKELSTRSPETGESVRLHLADGKVVTIPEVFLEHTSRLAARGSKPIDRFGLELPVDFIQPNAAKVGTGETVRGVVKVLPHAIGEDPLGEMVERWRKLEKKLDGAESNFPVDTQKDKSGRIVSAIRHRRGGGINGELCDHFLLNLGRNLMANLTYRTELESERVALRVHELIDDVTSE